MHACVIAILTIAGLCAVEFEKEKFIYSCCGKVHVIDHDSKKNLIDYIIEKSQKGWFFQLDDDHNTIIETTIPQYNGNIIDDNGR